MVFQRIATSGMYNVPLFPITKAKRPYGRFAFVANGCIKALAKGGFDEPGMCQRYQTLALRNYE